MTLRRKFLPRNRFAGDRAQIRPGPLTAGLPRQTVSCAGTAVLLDGATLMQALEGGGP